MLKKHVTVTLILEQERVLGDVIEWEQCHTHDVRGGRVDDRLSARTATRVEVDRRTTGLSHAADSTAQWLSCDLPGGWGGAEGQRR